MFFRILFLLDEGLSVLQVLKEPGFSSLDGEEESVYSLEIVVHDREGPDGQQLVLGTGDGTSEGAPRSQSTGTLLLDITAGTR